MLYFWERIAFAGIAQSVEQLIRNQQVVCSSHITSSKKRDTTLSCLSFFLICKEGEKRESAGENGLKACETAAGVVK